MTVGITAHRGASAYAPESTKAAFSKAKELGAKEVETDLRLTSDGLVVLCHDDDLSRYGHGPLIPEDISAEHFRRLDAGTWFAPEFSSERFYFLEDLLRDFKNDFEFDLEIKGLSPALPEASIRAVEKEGLIGKSTFISFSLDQLRRARAASATARLGFITETFPIEVTDECKKLGVSDLCLCADLGTPDAIREAKKSFTRIRFWGLPQDKPSALATASRLISAGCSGITIDQPDWLLP